MEEEKNNWSISKLYNKSWNIVKNNKVLWLFGIATVSFSSSSFRFQSSDLSSFKKLFPDNNTGDTTEKAAQVLGASASSAGEILGNLVSSVPIWIYVLLALGIVLFFLFGMIINLIFSAWANGALIAGINEAEGGQKPSVNQCSKTAFPAIKGLIWLNIVPGLVFFLTSILIIGILILAITVLSSRAIPIILLIITIPILLIGWILLAFTQIWAGRRVVLDRVSGKESFFSSFKVARKKFWKMFGLAAVNSLMSMFAGFIIVLPMIIVIGVLVFNSIASSKQTAFPSIPLLVLIVILALLYVVFSPILFGIINTFKASVWTLAYNRIKGIYNEN